MRKNETNTLVKSALLLTLAGLIGKVLSAGYRIPLQNLTGDYGFYIYSQVYPLLGIALILSLYGFPSAVAKIATTLKVDHHPLSFKSFYLPIFSVLMVMSCTLFLILFFSAGWLASLTGNIALTEIFQFAAYPFLLIPFTALLRGVFQAEFQMKPIAYAQMSEQIIRVGIIIYAAIVLSKETDQLIEIGNQAVVAAIAGSFMAMVVLFIYFLKLKPIQTKDFKIPWNYYIKTLSILGIAAALNHTMLLIMQFADTFTLVPNLIKYGLTPIAAMQAKGIFDRGQPLIQFGTVLGSSFALAIIPAISVRKIEADRSFYYAYIRRSLIFGLYLAIGVTIGLIVLFKQINILLFKNDAGTFSLQILMIAILLASLAMIISAILQGLGHMKRTAVFIIIAFIVKYFGNLLFVPIWGITGSAFATVCSLLLLCVLVAFALKKKLQELKLFRNIRFFALAKASFGMTIYLILLDYVCNPFIAQSRIALIFYLGFAIMTGAFLYITLLIKAQAYTEEELIQLPFGQIFKKIYNLGK